MSFRYWQSRARWVRSVVMGPLLLLLAGCQQADAPQMADAPPPPSPKAEELKAPNVGKAKTQYGAGEKYQRSMERLGKQGRSQ
jgi:hypothetical protein